MDGICQRKSLPRPTLSRRNFLKTTTSAAAGLSLPGRVERRTVSPCRWQRYDQAGADRLRRALGSGAANQAMNTGNVKLVAMADAFEKAVEVEPGYAASWRKNPGASGYVPTEHQFIGLDGYKQAMALADVVILATPPGFRPMHFEEAVRQGKNIFHGKSRWRRMRRVSGVISGGQ